MNRVKKIGALTALVMIAGCHKPMPATGATSTISEADATKIADATVASWSSMDAAKIKALYARSVVGFDAASAPLSTDRATWDKLQDAFAAAKIDNAAASQRKLQLLDSNTFVMSGTWDLSSSAIPAMKMTLRCTDVFEKGSDGVWLIVNEHCSKAPTS